jgi:hypothetical protein
MTHSQIVRVNNQQLCTIAIAQPRRQALIGLAMGMNIREEQQ